MLMLALSPRFLGELRPAISNLGKSGERGVLANHVATTGADLIVEDISMWELPNVDVKPEM